MKAMKLVGEELTSCVHSYRDIWLPAREIVQKAVSEHLQVTIDRTCVMSSISVTLCVKVDSSGAIIKLKTSCPWIDHLFELEKEMNLIGQIKFVLYKETERNRWRIQVSGHGCNNPVTIFHYFSAFQCL